MIGFRQDRDRESPVTLLTKTDYRDDNTVFDNRLKTACCQFQFEAQRASPQYGHSVPESLPDYFCPVSILLSNSSLSVSCSVTNVGAVINRPAAKCCDSTLVSGEFATFYCRADDIRPYSKNRKFQFIGQFVLRTGAYGALKASPGGEAVSEAD